jgi:anaerobic magnesium-protoporphyrin IX monomethyl ester cyclase
MKYLLVMPKKLSSIDHFNIFPIGLAYISASLKEAGHQVVTANLDFMVGDTHSILAELIVREQIDVLGSGGLSRDCGKLKEVFDTARRIKPDILTVVGGGIISSDPVPAMRILGADIGVIGEGEVTICELAQALENGINLNHVNGLIYLDRHGDLHKTPKRIEINDIDRIPFPDFDGFSYKEWVQSSGGGGTVLSDRSCPFHCTFCFHPTGEKYRQRSLDNIFKEIDHQVKHYGVTCIGLTSELFSTKKQRVVDFCRRIKEYEIPWSCCLRVNDVDADMLKMMRTSNCSNVVLGLESADNEILKSMRKGTTVQQIERALDLTYEANLMVEGGFIFGDVNEDWATASNTLAFWKKHNQRHYLNLSMIYVFPGSQLYTHACDSEIISNREQYLRDGCPLINVSKMSPAEFVELTSTITELRLHPHVPAGPFQILNMEADGECQVQFACRKCHFQNKAKVNFWFGREIRCSSCNLTNFVDPFQKALHVQQEFTDGLPDDGVVAMWGAGGVYYKLMQKDIFLYSERFVLMDSDMRRQGLRVCKKEVHAPDVIPEQKINTVIITALSRTEEIYAALRSRYPWVESVLVPALKMVGEDVVPVLKPFGKLLPMTKNERQI